MNNSIEPWKLTAYLLGELEPDETQQLRAAIEADPSLQVQLKELQQVIARVQSVMQSPHTEPGLTDGQAAAIADQIQQARLTFADEGGTLRRNDVDFIKSSNSFVPSRNRLRLIAISVLAASILLIFFVSPVFVSVFQVAHQSRDVKGSKDPSSIDDARRIIAETVDSTWDRTPVEDTIVSYQNNHSLVVSAALETNETSGKVLKTSPPSPHGTPRGEGRGEGLNFQAEAAPHPSPLPGVPGRGNKGSVNLNDLLDGSVNASAPGDNVGGTPLVYDISPAPNASQPLNEEFRELGKSTRPQAERPEIALTPSIILADDIFGDVKVEYVGELGLVIARGSAEDVRRTVETIEQLSAIAPSQSGDRYEPIVETPFISTEKSPLSTFSIDVDTASYSKIRQYLMQANQLPQPNAVRIEEMINYFEYDYAGPTDEHPFASNMAVATCPWNEDHKLVRIGLQAKKIDVKERAKANLVFLLDVSGSMDEPNKLPLVKQAMSMLIRQLGENDRIAMVVYAGAAGCVLPSITGDKQSQILAALEDLNAGGSTNGGQGIELAYSIAREHFIPGGINRVILCTDGDFNVGTTSNEALVKLIQEQAKSKVFLTCLGFGIGNYNDSMMEQLSNQGNGVYGMVDNALEARRIMIEQLAGTLVTVAKDVKIQVEFNPAKIAGYRLIGYENRRLANEDFNNDKKDAGEIGAGHRVTALYEVVPIGAVPKENPVDELRYGRKTKDPSPPAPLPGPLTLEKEGRGAGTNSSSRLSPRGELQERADTVSNDLSNTVPSNSEGINNSVRSDAEFAKEWLTLKLRYKQPEADVSSKLEFFLTDEAVANMGNDVDFRWSSAVAEFGLLLRRSQLAPQANWDRMIQRARASTGENAYRLECLELMTKAKSLAGQ